MAKMTRVIATLGALALVSYIGLQPAFADQAPNPSAPAAQAPAQPAPTAQAPAQKPESAKGELRSVDVAKKTLTVAAEGAPAQVFQYTDATKVTGAKDAEGLATMSGRQVTVQYTMKGADRVATAIEVAAKSKRRRHLKQRSWGTDAASLRGVWAPCRAPQTPLRAVELLLDPIPTALRLPPYTDGLCGLDSCQPEGRRQRGHFDSACWC